MKAMTTHFLLCLGVGALVMACEPGGGGGDATSSTTGSSTTGSSTGIEPGTTGAPSITGTPGTTGEPPVEEWAAIELEDDPNNPTLDPCDGGSLKSPGADIDAAELLDGSDIIADLSNCTISGTTACENDSADPSNAEGAPNSDGTETTGQYIALNGGLMRCEWSGGEAARSGDVIDIYEVGGSSGTKVEQYHVRLCKNTGGNCTIYSNFASGDASFSVDSLL